MSTCVEIKQKKSISLTFFHIETPWEEINIVDTWNTSFTLFPDSEEPGWTSRALIRKRYSNKNRKQLNPELNEIHGQNNQIAPKKKFIIYYQNNGSYTVHIIHTTWYGLSHFCHLCTRKVQASEVSFKRIQCVHAFPVTFFSYVMTSDMEEREQSKLHDICYSKMHALSNLLQICTWKTNQGWISCKQPRRFWAIIFHMIQNLST